MGTPPTPLQHADVLNGWSLIVLWLPFWFTVDCLWSDWSDFSTCTKTCGDGLETRERSIEENAINNGKPCEGKNSDTRACKIIDCPGNKVCIKLQVFVELRFVANNEHQSINLNFKFFKRILNLIQITDTCHKFWYTYYGNTGCCVFKQMVQTWKYFCL